MEQTYFDDVVIGEEVVSPGLTVTTAHVGLYGGLTGDAAVDSGGVPELLLLALSTGLGWRVNRAPLAVMAFLGFEWEILHPIRVGDTISGMARAAARRSMRDGGVIIEDHEIIDQRGVVVQRGRFTFLVAKRPKGPAQKGATTS